MTFTANDREILKLMKITSVDTGEVIPFEYNAFPDGQVQLKIKQSYLFADGKDMRRVNVKVSIANPVILDLFKQLWFCLLVNDLKINYHYGARCDKHDSGDYYVCPVADYAAYHTARPGFCLGQVEVLAPHCDASYFDKRVKIDFNLPDCVNLDDYDLVIYPDESARRRFSAVEKDYVVCEKHRNQEDGQILSHVIPNLPEGCKKVILCDDLCDGGRTFLNVADALPEGVKADLFIFHGVFSNGAVEKLLYKFDRVFVSNSLPAAKDQQLKFFSEATRNRVVIFDVWEN